MAKAKYKLGTLIEVNHQILSEDGATSEIASKHGQIVGVLATQNEHLYKLFGDDNFYPESSVVAAYRPVTTRTKKAKPGRPRLGKKVFSEKEVEQ